MATKVALLDCLEAAYRMDLEGSAYVNHVAEKAAVLLDRGLGVLTFTYVARPGSSAVIDHHGTSARFDPRWLAVFYGAVGQGALFSANSSRATGYESWSHMTCGQASQVPGMRQFLPAFSLIGGARDTFAINACDASGRGLWIGAPMRVVRRASKEKVEFFTHFAAHLASAVRLRRTGATRERPAAVLSSSGALLDASGPDAIGARDELRRATVAYDRARVRRGPAGPGEVMQRWRPLIVSRWSLMDEFDSDGKRFVVAIENGPPTRPPRRDLSEREHQVLTQAHLGHSNKVIAYELGLSSSTVRVLLHRAARKLGASTRAEALARFEALARAAAKPAH